MGMVSVQGEPLDAKTASRIAAWLGCPQEDIEAYDREAGGRQMWGFPGACLVRLH